MVNNDSELINQDNPEENWKIVITSNNNIEQQVLISLLESEDIPHFEKTTQVNSFIKVLVGFPVGNVDIYVPNDKYEKALELISNREELHDDYDVSGDD